MGISCGATLIKYLLFFFNLLWLALGGAILYFGFRITSFSGDFEDVVDNSIKTGAIVVLVAGFVIFLIAFLGCCGAIRESSCMLSAYGGIILLLVIVQCVGAYLAFKYRTDIEGEINKGIEDTLDKIQKLQDPKALKAINKFQETFECCGAHDSTDWGKRGLPVPGSCCGIDWDKTCTNNIYEGCVDKVTNSVKNTLGGLGGVAIALVLIQLLIIVSACCLAREVRS